MASWLMSLFNHRECDVVADVNDVDWVADVITNVGPVGSTWMSFVGPMGPTLPVADYIALIEEIKGIGWITGIAGSAYGFD